MHSMEQAYAQALWQMIENGMEPKKALRSLIGSLEAHGRKALLPRIARAFERLAEREMRKNAVVVFVAREEDAAHAKRKVKPILDEADIAAKEIDVRIDGSLIGGWRLEGRGLLLDNSFKRSLLDMYNRAIA